jgi:hypothetical protein
MSDMEKDEYKAFIEVLKIFLKEFPEIEQTLQIVYQVENVPEFIVSNFKNEEKRINRALYKVYKFLKSCYE